MQNNFSLHDSLSWALGRHNLRFGGGISRLQYNMREFRFVGQLNFPTWPDFLMGLNAANNGTGPAPPPDFSNIIASVDFIGLPDRNWRVWEADAYTQDDFKPFANLTLNLGLRYERLGHLGERPGAQRRLRYAAGESHAAGHGHNSGLRRRLEFQWDASTGRDAGGQ